MRQRQRRESKDAPDGAVFGKTGEGGEQFDGKAVGLKTPNVGRARCRSELPKTATHKARSFPASPSPTCRFENEQSGTDFGKAGVADDHRCGLRSDCPAMGSQSGKLAYPLTSPFSRFIL